ncbi:MAG: AAA family ATPase, partial [Nocardioidaceae bacterium]
MRAGTRREWPFSARREELDVVTSVITDSRGDEPSGVVVVGQSGVGKTRLAREAVAWAASQGVPTAWAIGTRSAATMPYAALAHLAPAVDPTAYADVGSLYRSFVAALAPEGGRRRVLVIDDAHLLDAGSAALVLHLALTGAVTVVVTVRRGEPVADPITTLWKDGLAVRVDLQEFSAEETESLIDEVLGHEVGAQTRRRLAAASGGNVLYARELTLGAIETGSLRRSDGVWRWDGQVPPAPRLVDAVGQRLEGLRPEDREALALVALGEPLDVAVAEEVAGAAAIARVETAGLVRATTTGGTPTCRLAHPLYGEVLLSSLGVVERRRLMRVLAHHLERHGAGGEDELMRVAAWGLEGGGDPKPTALVTAATIANRSFDYALGERLARAAVDRQAGITGAVALATALNGQNRFEESEAVLGPLEPEVAGEPDPASGREYLEQRYTALNLGLGRRREMTALLDRYERSHADQGSRHLVAGYRANLLLDEGRMGEVVAVTAPVLADPEADDFSVVLAAETAAEALAYLGSTTAARTLHDRLRALPQTVELSRASRAGSSADLQAILCLILEGRASDAVRIIGGYYDHLVGSRDDATRGLAALGLGAALLLQGRPARARRVLSDGADALARADLGVALAWASALRAQAEALLGDVEAARQAQKTSHSDRRSRWAARCQSDFVVADVLVQMASGGPGTAGRLALEGAERLHDLEVYRAMVLHLAVRMGEPPALVAPALAEIAANVESGLPRLLADHVTALADQDGTALEPIAARFDELGMWLVAAEASAHA